MRGMQGRKYAVSLEDEISKMEKYKTQCEKDGGNCSRLVQSLRKGNCQMTGW